MNHRKILAITALFLLAVSVDARSPYAPSEGWPPCGAIAAEGEKTLDGLAVTGVICRSTAFMPDSDGDGVSNDADRCLETPAGTEVNGIGCPLDNDNDGVANSLDRCVDTPIAAGVDVDSSGCPVDRDNNGVPDYLDERPDAPKSAKLSNEGFPINSGDAPAYQGRCSGAKLNGKGCSEKPALAGVYFALDSAKLTPESRKTLNKIAKSLHYRPGLKITIAGYADSLGTKAYNQLLSQLRAEAVMNYLVSRGISPAMLKAVGYGEQYPVASNATQKGRAKNRRVEFLTPANR